MTSGRHRFDDSGAVAAEFGLVFPLAASLIGMLTAFGLWGFWSAMADNAARDMARYASIPKSDGTYPTTTDVTTKVKGELGGVPGTPTSVLVTPQPVGSAPGEGDLVTVQLTYNVPGVTTMTGLVNAIPGLGNVNLSFISSVTQTATARRE